MVSIVICQELLLDLVLVPAETTSIITAQSHSTTLGERIIFLLRLSERHVDDRSTKLLLKLKFADSAAFGVTGVISSRFEITLTLILLMPLLPPPPPPPPPSKHVFVSL